MSTLDLLVVGPAHSSTGGVARYVTQQRRHLPDDVRVTVHDNGAATSRRLPGRLGLFLASLAAIFRFLFRSPPDVVHVHTSHGVAFYRASFFVLFAAVVWNRPVVVHVHGSSFDEFVKTKNPAVLALQTAVFRASSSVIVLSEYWRRVLGRRVKTEKIRVLRNAVDATQFESSNGHEELPTVVFVSNHVRRKGIVELTEAIDRLTDEGVAEFETHIAGDGPLADRAERLASRHENVTYHGYVSENEKRRLINEGSIYVLPSYAEGLPIALLEGMAGGNAVVTTEVGSIPEVVDEGNGRLVAPGNAVELADAIAELTADLETTAEISRRNSQLVENEYSWKTVSDSLVKEYRAVAN